MRKRSEHPPLLCVIVLVVVVVMHRNGFVRVLVVITINKLLKYKHSISNRPRGPIKISPQMQKALSPRSMCQNVPALLSACQVHHNIIIIHLSVVKVEFFQIQK